MKIIYEYSHLGGYEILKVRYPQQLDEIYEIITKIEARRTKTSKEKTMKGKMLYSPVDMNKRFGEAFSEKGYGEIRDTYIIRIPIKRHFPSVPVCLMLIDADDKAS